MRNRRARTGAALVALCCAGCTRGGAVDLLELNFRQIPAEAPLIEHVAFDDGYWWVDADRLCVAARHFAAGVPDENARREFALSFVLPGLPAERARDYRVTAQSLRACAHAGPNHARYASTQGVVGVWFENQDTLRARFRLVAHKETFHILTGWTKVGPVVLVGELRARRAEQRGKPILVRTEEGMPRADEEASTDDDRPRPVRVEGPPVQ